VGFALALPPRVRSEQSGRLAVARRMFPAAIVSAWPANPQRTRENTLWAGRLPRSRTPLMSSRATTGVVRSAFATIPLEWPDPGSAETARSAAYHRGGAAWAI